MSGLAGWVGTGDADLLEEMVALLGPGEQATDVPLAGPALAVVMPSRAEAHLATLGHPGQSALRIALATDGSLEFAPQHDLDPGCGVESPPARSAAEAHLASAPDNPEDPGAPALALCALASAYRKDPARFSARMSGRFAFALWDVVRQRLVLACDRSGAKSLFWTITGGTFNFATSIKALLTVPGVKRRLDEIALDEFLTQGFTGGTRTLFRGVQRLPPGHELVLERGTTTVRPYWTPANADELPSRTGVQGLELEGLLADTVRTRLAGESSTGCFLNGSVDSSVVLALLRESGAGRVQTFAVDWAGSDGDREAARRIAHAFDTEHHELEMSAPSNLDLIELTWLLDLPVSTPSVFSTYVLSGLAREHVGRVFSGQGASQLFGRRPGHGPGGTPGPLAGLRALLARLPGCKHLSAVASGDLPGGEPPLFDAHARHQLYSLDLRGRIARRLVQRDAEPLDDDLPPGAGTGPLRGAKPLKLGRATRAQRVDLELPYLDTRVIEWAGRLAPEPAGTHLAARVALREVARRLLPDWAAGREGRKRSLPIASWLRGPLSSFTAVLLGEAYVRRQGLFDPARITELLGRLRTGDPAGAAKVWRLMAFQLWYLIFLEDEDRAREQISKARQTDRIPVRSDTPMPPVRL